MKPSKENALDYIYNPEESLMTDEYGEMMRQLYGLEMEVGE